MSSPATTSVSLLARASRLPARTAAWAERARARRRARRRRCRSRGGWRTRSEPSSPQSDLAAGIRRTLFRKPADLLDAPVDRDDLGRKRRACSASSSDGPARRQRHDPESVRAAAATTSSVETPIEPVEPSIESDSHASILTENGARRRPERRKAANRPGRRSRRGRGGSGPNPSPRRRASTATRRDPRAGRRSTRAAHERGFGRTEIPGGRSRGRGRTRQSVAERNRRACPRPVFLGETTGASLRRPKRRPT